MLIARRSKVTGAEVTTTNAGKQHRKVGLQIGI